MSMEGRERIRSGSTTQIFMSIQSERDNHDDQWIIDRCAVGLYRDFWRTVATVIA